MARAARNCDQCVLVSLGVPSHLLLLEAHPGAIGLKSCECGERQTTRTPRARHDPGIVVSLEVIKDQDIAPLQTPAQFAAARRQTGLALTRFGGHLNSFRLRVCPNGEAKLQ